MSGLEGRIAAISVSRDKGESKTNVDRALLLKEWGIEGDAHAGNWDRQVSLLAMESIEKMRAQGAQVHPGDFGENLTVEFADLSRLRIGDRVRIGAILLEITQLGKECHEPCAIYHQIGDCVMPRDGLFARVLRGGRICVGELLTIETGKTPK